MLLLPMPLVLPLLVLPLPQLQPCLMLLVDLASMLEPLPSLTVVQRKVLLIDLLWLPHLLTVIFLVLLECFLRPLFITSRDLFCKITFVVFKDLSIQFFFLNSKHRILLRCRLVPLVTIIC